MTQLQNRSLDRGITLMEILARTGASTLAGLQAESGLPKSTIRRLLGTLQARRLVRRSLSDRKYRINITLPVSTGAPLPRDLAIYVDVAMPLLSELTRAIDWPSDLHIIDGYTMRVIDSTRPLSPFHLYRGIVNRTLNIFGTATGQACLAEMSDAEVRAVIARARGDTAYELERYKLSEADFLAMIEETRQRGYGVRFSIYVGDTIIHDGLAALGVPVFKGGAVIGAISLLFPRKLMSPHAMAERCLDQVKATAQRISADLDRFA